MNRIFLGAMGIAVLMVFIAGCASPPALVAPTAAAFSLPTLIPRTSVPATPTTAPTPVSPTPTSLSTATIGVSTTQGPADQTPLASGSPTASPSPSASPTPLPSPTSAVPRGLFVTDLRIDPPPARGAELKFYATFINSMDQEQNYRWAVYIFRADTQKGIGETTRTDTPIPTGTVEQPSSGSWKLGLGGPCEYLYAQVGWLNADKSIVWFTAPSGSVFQKGFTVCPP